MVGGGAAVAAQQVAALAALCAGVVMRIDAGRLHRRLQERVIDQGMELPQAAIVGCTGGR
jgi:hypothetical protein